MSRRPEALLGGAVHELPFREAFLAGIPDPIATVLRALGQWMHDELVEQGMMDAPTDPRTLLRRLRRDLQAVEAGLGEVLRSVESAAHEAHPELIDAVRVFDVEVRDLAARMEAVSGRPSAATACPTEVTS